jgi:hypothetical protein
MMLSGTAYQLPPLAHLTDETASGYWPTPTVLYTRGDWEPERIIARQQEVKAETLAKGKHHTGNGFGLNLAQAVRMWPTPNARTLGGGEYQDPEKIRVRWSKGRQKNLSEAVKLFPTPTSRDWKDGSAPRFREGVQQFDTLGRAVGGTLNPQWVEWLMGFPVGWTDLSSSETP